MSLSAAPMLYDVVTPVEEERFLPLQLADTAEATARLISEGLATRGLAGSSLLGALTDADGRLRPEAEALARAYEAALLASLSPTEVKTLRRLLIRVEVAAQKLAGVTS